MNRSIQLIVALAVGCCILMTATPLLAQEWSKEQQEVWKNVQAYWELSSKRDLEGFMKYIHDDYCGWYNDDPLPSNKAAGQKWMAFFFPRTETLIYDINPVAIKIHGNFAFVHYYFMQVRKDLEGKIKYAQGRWTDILMKQGDKWMIIGDHGGETGGE